MRRIIRFIVVLVLSLAFVPYLPLYVERTLLRSMRIDRAGDQIEWGWKLTSLSDYWSNYNYMTREQRPALWFTLDIALAVMYALILAVVVDRILAWTGKRGRR